MFLPWHEVLQMGVQRRRTAKGTFNNATYFNQVAALQELGLNCLRVGWVESPGILPFGPCILGGAAVPGKARIGTCLLFVLQ